MADLVIERSGLAPLSVVREVELLAPKAVAAVEGHFGIGLPPVTVVVAGRTGLATWSLMAAGWRRGTVRARVAFWRHMYQEAEGYGLTSVTGTDRVLIGLNGPRLRRSRKELWPTLVHELVHAVQADRPGRRGELRAVVDHNLLVRPLSPGLTRAAEAVREIEEAEAHAVEYALDPDADLTASFDVAAMAVRFEEAVQHWTNAALSCQAI